MKTYLCIDYGQKHLGVAIASTILAEPIGVIPRDNALSTIQQLILDNQVDILVFGLSEGQMAQETKSFAQDLSSQTGLPVFFQDETLSSQDMRRQLAKKGTKRSVREAKIDHLVAAAILQDFLDSHSRER